MHFGLRRGGVTIMLAVRLGFTFARFFLEIDFLEPHCFGRRYDQIEYRTKTYQTAFSRLYEPIWPDWPENHLKNSAKIIDFCTTTKTDNRELIMLSFWVSWGRKLARIDLSRAWCRYLDILWKINSFMNWPRTWQHYGHLCSHVIMSVMLDNVRVIEHRQLFGQARQAAWIKETRVSCVSVMVYCFLSIIEERFGWYHSDLSGYFFWFDFNWQLVNSLLRQIHGTVSSDRLSVARCLIYERDSREIHRETATVLLRARSSLLS